MDCELIDHFGLTAAYPSGILYCDRLRVCPVLKYIHFIIHPQHCHHTRGVHHSLNPPASIAMCEPDHDNHSAVPIRFFPSSTLRDLSSTLHIIPSPDMRVSCISRLAARRTPTSSRGGSPVVPPCNQNFELKSLRPLVLEPEDCDGEYPPFPALFPNIQASALTVPIPNNPPAPSLLPHYQTPSISSVYRPFV